MVKPNENNNKNVAGVQQTQQQQTFRSQQQMRMITMPAGTVQTTGTGQIIQTHIMPQGMLKPVDTTGRTQITSLPARTLTQGSITVSRSTAPATYVSRGPGVTNIQGIRTPTPPSIITNIGSSFVRGTVPPKSPAGTILTSPGSTSTWLSGPNTVVQVPAQFIRNPNINQSPRQQHHQQQHQLQQQQRIVTQTTPITVNTSMIGQTQQQLQQTASQQSQHQIVTSQNSQQQPQAFVATLATVIPSRQPSAATLVYSNAQQHYGTTTQRLAVAASLGQRQGRPIQLSTVRLPNTVGNMGVRVSAANVPVLAPTSVLTSGGVLGQNTIQGRVTTGTISSATGAVGATTTNLTTGNIPATRIIQVQQPQQQQQQQQQSGTTQVIGSGRIAGGLMTLHPVIVNTTTGNRNPTTIAAKVQPSLTITHVKSAVGQNQSTIQQTTAQQQQHLNQQHQTIAPQSGSTTTSNPQIAQIVVNQQGIVNQGHQIVTVSQQQLISAQNQSGGITTVLPVSINSRTTTNVLTGTINTISSGGIVRGPTNIGGQSQTPSSILPIAKVIPQQQHPQHQNQQQLQMTSESNQITVSGQQQQQTANVLIHTRSPSSGPASGTTVNQGQFLPASGTFYYEHTSNSGSGNPVLTLTTSSINSAHTNSGNQISTTNLGTNLVSSVTYAPSAGSFAVVPTNNRGISQIHGNLGILPTSNPQTGQLQAVPVRFNPQLIVDGSQTHQGTHQIITMPQGTGISTQQTSNQQTHMLIPVSSTKLTASPRPSILRKRDIDGPSPIKVAKNLGPTLISIGNNANIDREREIDRDRDPSPQSRPGSSEGSTTASAISSPCLDQQDPEEIPNMILQNDMQFKPVETMYPITQSASSTTASTTTTTGHSIQHQISTGSSSNDNDVTPRKKPRKQQLGGDNIEPHLSYVNEDIMYPTENNKTNNTSSNKENAQPVEVTFKKPRTSLLENYKQTFKPANNHFQRYADVRPREERRPNVMDLANQAHVLQKVNGWKIYHLSSQMEELCELESQVHRKLSDMLQSMEAHDSQSDIERVTDLIKGNRQRSKVIIDGVQDARSQIMKIFDHKAHVSDIIHRCASKRNFKKREKM